MVHCKPMLNSAYYADFSMGGRWANYSLNFRILTTDSYSWRHKDPIHNILWCWNCDVILLFLMLKKVCSNMYCTLKDISHHDEKKELGTRAIYSVLVQYLHPARTVKETLVNMHQNEQRNDLVAIWEENKIVNRKNQPCLIFCYEQFDGLWLVKWFTRVGKECHPDHTFSEEWHRERNDDNNTVTAALNNPNRAEVAMVPLPDDIIYMENFCAKDIGTVRGTGFSEWNRSWEFTPGSGNWHHSQLGGQSSWRMDRVWWLEDEGYSKCGTFTEIFIIRCTKRDELCRNVQALLSKINIIDNPQWN